MDNRGHGCGTKRARLAVLSLSTLCNPLSAGLGDGGLDGSALCLKAERRSALVIGRDPEKAAGIAALGLIAA